MKFLGYLNKHLYTDILSYAVFSDGNQLFAQEAVKRANLKNVPFCQGGFAGHFSEDDLRHETRIANVELKGEIFPIKCLRGKYGYWEFNPWLKTKSGKSKKNFVILSDKIEDKCLYYYDYNF